MSEIDLNELRRRILESQRQGTDTSSADGKSVHVGPGGQILIGNANERGIREASKLPPTIFAF
jgi:hypothetical protein